MTPGKIIIKDQKVYFEYYKSEKPNKKIYDKAKVYNFENLIIQKYEASKQLVEVNNVLNVARDYQQEDIWKAFIDTPNILKDMHSVVNDQPCKAEITDNKATIVELIK